MTPWQTEQFAIATQKRLKMMGELSIANAWWSEAFHRHKKLPPLTKFIGDQVVSSEKAGIKSPEDLVNSLKRAFGVKK